MKPILFLILAFLLASNIHQTQGQTQIKEIPTEIYNPKACGCDSTTKYKDFKADSLKNMLLDTTFKAWIDTLNNNKNNSAAFSQAVIRVAKQLKEQLAIESEPLKVVGERSDVEPFKKALASCTMAELIHLHYLNNPSAAPREKQDLYKKYHDSLSQKASPTKVTEATAPEVERSPSKSNESAVDWSSMTLYAIIIASVLLNLILMLRVVKAGQKEHQMAELKKDIEELKETQKKLLEEKKTKESDFNSLNKQMAELKRKLELKDQQILALEYKQKNNQNTSAPNYPHQNQDFQQQPLAPSKVLFLDAPTPQGVFYNNSVSEQKGLNSLYTVKLSPNEQEGAITLIHDEAIVKRAESMFSELIDPVCEVHSSGRINTSSLQQTPGKIRREGAGWRIEKKIILKW